MDCTGLIRCSIDAMFKQIRDVFICRYENGNFFTEANNRAGVVLLCDNTTSPQPEEFRNAAKKLMSNLQIAAPRTTDFYVASTRKGK